MKILHVVGQIGHHWGGVSMFAAESASALARLGEDVTLLTRPTPTGEGSYRLDPSITLLQEGLPTDDQLRNFDVIHVHGLWLPFYHRALAAARRAGVPAVISPHGMLEPAALRFSRWKKRAAWLAYQRRDLKRAAAIHATAPNEAQTIAGLGLGRPIIQIPPGVHLPEADSLAGKKGTRRVAFLGRLHPIKGIDLLVEAWLRVNPPGWTLEVAGPDEAGLRDRLAHRVATSGTGASVDWLGPAFGDAKTRLLERADWVAVPSLSENFAITVVEAMAFGAPVLATTATPWQDLPSIGAGWVCEPNVESLARAVATACATPPEMLVRMGEVARRWVGESYTWGRAAELLVDGYRQTIGRGEAAPAAGPNP